jgi:hypothetical protein
VCDHTRPQEETFTKLNVLLWCVVPKLFYGKCLIYFLGQEWTIHPRKHSRNWFSFSVDHQFGDGKKRSLVVSCLRVWLIPAKLCHKLLLLAIHVTCTRCWGIITVQSGMQKKKYVWWEWNVHNWRFCLSRARLHYACSIGVVLQWNPNSLSSKLDMELVKAPKD